MKSFEWILKSSQNHLFRLLKRSFPHATVSHADKYVLVRGTAPVLLVAHLDTVHKERVLELCSTEDGSVLMSPQGIGGDDRCGVYGIWSVYEKSNVKPWLLFTCDEEIGGRGAESFSDDFTCGALPAELKDLKCIIELDRKGNNDAVYYDCDNREFEAYISSCGFVTQFGSFSDISIIAPVLGVAAVNLSSGYYNAHTLHEYINTVELEDVVQKVVKIVADSIQESFPVYEYIGYERYARFASAWYDDPFVDDSLEAKYTHIPLNIRKEYAYLAQFYEEGELDEYRKEYGDGMILQLYEDEVADEFEYASAWR